MNVRRFSCKRKLCSKRFAVKQTKEVISQFIDLHISQDLINLHCVIKQSRY